MHPAFPKRNHYPSAAGARIIRTGLPSISPAQFPENPQLVDRFYGRSDQDCPCPIPRAKRRKVQHHLRSAGYLPRALYIIAVVPHMVDLVALRSMDMLLTRTSSCRSYSACQETCFTYHHDTQTLNTKLSIMYKS